MFVVGRFGDDACQVVVYSSGHADVEVLGGGGPVDDEHSLVHGDPLGFVHGDGVGQCDVVGHVLAGEGDASPPVQGCCLDGAVVAAVKDLPAVAVSDPCPGRGHQAAVV